MQQLINIFSQPVIAQQGAEAAPGGGMMQMIILGLLFVGMWFLMIAPQRKRQKAHQKMIQELTTGDSVLTNGGIYGTITNVKEDRYVIKVGENTKMEVNKSFIHSKTQASQA